MINRETFGKLGSRPTTTMTDWSDAAHTEQGYSLDPSPRTLTVS